MSEFDTFGITLPVRDWRALLELSQRVDRSPSDYLRLLIREQERVNPNVTTPTTPTSGAALGDGQGKRESAGSIPTTQDLKVLRQFIIKHFNDSELRDLCLDMSVDYEVLRGDNKADKARELVAYCERRQIIPDLVARCKELRPKASWEGEHE